MTSTSDGLPNPDRILAFLAIAFAMTMAVLDSAIVNVALPTIARDLAASPQAAILVVNGYQIAITVCLLPFAALGDGLGYRRVYLFGLALFTAASLGCALAGSLPLLVASRVVQGVGAAGIMSVNIALVRFIYPHAMIGRAVGNTALVVAVSSASGPTIAAGVLSVASWPWLFLVNVPIGMVALAIAIRTVPTTPSSGARFDGTSALLNALTFGLLVLGIDGLGDPGRRPAAIAALVACAIIGVVFVRRQIRLPVPLLPIDLLRIPIFALSMATSICSFAAQAMSYIALPFYFQDVLHRSETDTGFLMTPWPLAVAFAAPIAGRLSDRYAPGKLGGIGLATLSLGLLLTARLPADPSAFDVVWRLTLCGLGFGLFQSPNNRVIITSAPRERSGGASGMQSTARLVGQSLGAAAVAVIFGIAAHERAITLALLLSAGLAAAGCVASSLRRQA